MKRNINSIICVSALAASLLASCQADFEDINRDHRQPTEEQLEQDNLNVGGFVTSFEESIFPVGSSGTGYVNDYQIPYTLAGACRISNSTDYQGRSSSQSNRYLWSNSLYQGWYCWCYNS